LQPALQVPLRTVRRSAKQNPGTGTAAHPLPKAFFIRTEEEKESESKALLGRVATF